MCKVKGKEKELFIITLPLNGFILGISGAILWRSADSMEFSDIRGHNSYRVERHRSQLWISIPRSVFSMAEIQVFCTAWHKQQFCNQKQLQFTESSCFCKEMYHLKNLKDLGDEDNSRFLKTSIGSPSVFFLQMLYHL